MGKGRYSNVKSGSSSTAPKPRVQQGPKNDLADRMRDTYKPGAGPKMAEGFGNPIKQIKDALKKGKK